MKSVVLILTVLVILSSCLDGANVDTPAGASVSGEWSIPINEVFDGGPGRDGIPALDNPEKINVDEASFLMDTELVTGYFDGQNAIAYPHQILDWHEIANDELNGFSYAITYCPLTGTGIGWDRNVDGSEVTFGVSGLLYNNNLVPFDRGTLSNWSQARLDCVNGALRGARINTFQLLETTWATWKEMYPETEVLSTNTGHDRSYGTYPYGDYRTNESNLIFPLSIDDRRLNRKERVHGLIVNNEAKVYRFASFSVDSTTLINDQFNGEQIVIVGNRTRNFIVSFYSQLEAGGETLNFTAVNEAGIVLRDNLGNEWDAFGYAVSGPNEGERLRSTESFIGYWFAWGTFYPDAEIYE